MHRPDWLAFCAAALAAVAQAGPAEAANGWHCRNADLEVSCAGGKCGAAEAHTPMDVHVSAEAISVCAYTGCWEGVPAATLASGPFVTYSGTALAFSTNPADKADVSVTVETRARVASILVAGRYVSPATCIPAD